MNFRVAILSVIMTFTGLQAEDSISVLTLNGPSDECSTQVELENKLCQHKDKILESGINEDIFKQALTFKARNPLLTSPEVFVAPTTAKTRKNKGSTGSTSKQAKSKRPMSLMEVAMFPGETRKGPDLHFTAVECTGETKIMMG